MVMPLAIAWGVKHLHGGNHPTFPEFTDLNFEARLQLVWCGSIIKTLTPQLLLLHTSYVPAKSGAGIGTPQT